MMPTQQQMSLGGPMHARTITAAATAVLALTLTACASNTSSDSTAAAEPSLSSSTPKPAASTTLSPECRAWIQKEILDSTESIDATTGVAVCGDLSDAEMDKAIEDVTDDLTAQGATAAAKEKDYPDGDYIVGEDIPPGTYTTTGAAPGEFLCAITTKPTDDTTFPQLKSADANERIIITLTKADGTVTIQGCEPLTARK